MRNRLLFFLISFFILGSTSAQHIFAEDWTELRGDAAIAERYLLWAEDAIAAEQWSQALAVLERAVDFNDVSSDISYLFAFVLSHENKNRGSILQALRQAIETRRWTRYSEADARLLQARQFIALRRYSSALECLAARREYTGDDPDSAMLRLEVLKGLVFNGPVLLPGLFALPAPAEFRLRMLQTMDRYPRDPRPLRILFDYAARREPAEDDAALITLALRRLPFLLEIDGDLAWMAAPFIADVAEARRLVGAYRSGSLLAEASDFRPTPASLVPALNLGLLDDLDAVEELFARETLDKDLIISIGRLLRSEEGRDSLVRRLHTFTGTITEDEDQDGYPESRAIYRQGVLYEYHYDADQDGIDEMVIVFDSGAPHRAQIATLPEAGQLGPISSSSHSPLPIPHSQIHWERYPSVEKVVLGNDTYLFPPRGFLFSPIVFEELGATENFNGLLYPRRDAQSQGITRRMLSYFAVSVQRPSNLGFGVKFDGGVEYLYLERGVPYRAEVIIDGMVVSITEFENGRPVVQRLDLDLDGRMETVRRFRDFEGGLEVSQSDWNNDGVFEYSELYHDDGSVVYRWEYLEQ